MINATLFVNNIRNIGNENFEYLFLTNKKCPQYFNTDFSSLSAEFFTGINVNPHV